MALYQIAGLKVWMEPTGQTLTRAEPYRIQSPGPADCRVTCDPRYVLERNPTYGDLDTAQYMGTGMVFARQLLRFGGFQLHASAVALEGKAYLFSAPSGTGKSTHTEKWCRLFGAELLNDDKPALRCVDGTWMACGTPWSGKHDLSSPRVVPLAAIAFLRRGQENAIEPLLPEEAVPLIFSQCPRLLEMEQMEAQLTLMDDLLRRVPVWLLTARNDDDAARMARVAMGGAPWRP